MRVEKLKILKRSDTITSKYCNNEWIGDAYWNIVLDFIYGDILKFPCLPWNFETLFDLKFETFYSLHFSDLKGMMATHL